MNRYWTIPNRVDKVSTPEMIEFLQQEVQRLQYEMTKVFVKEYYKVVYHLLKASESRGSTKSHHVTKAYSSYIKLTKKKEFCFDYSTCRS